MTTKPLRAFRLGLCALIAPALALAGFAGTDLFLPMAGRHVGVYPSNWYTTVWVHNPGAQAATARIYFLERGTANPKPPWVDVLVAPGDTEKIENAVESLFHVQAYGAIRVACATQKLVVTSRVYSKVAGAQETDSLGQDFSGVPASFAIGLGEKTQILGVHQTLPSNSSEHRYNFGFVETTGHSATVRVSAYDGNNAYQGFKDFNVLAYSQRQVAFKDHFPTVSTENSRLEVEVIAGAGKIIVYGSAVANGSQDPTTFDMTYADTLLAENAAAGITGVTAGNGLSGGGTSGTVTLDVGAGAGIAVAADTVSIADGGVTAAKLAADAVTSDKVLDGTIASADVAFNYAGSSSKGGAATSLVLPFSGAGTQAEPSAVFAISNSGTGPAIQGTSTSPGVGVRGVGTTGVEGDSGAGTGVLGQSSSLYGVHGLSTSGFGVRGDSTGSDGVYGTSASGLGVSGLNTSSGNHGYLGGAFYGAYGQYGGAGPLGYLGSASHGVWGESSGNGGAGVAGENDNAQGFGVYGASTSGVAVNGYSGGSGIGVKGFGATGVRGEGNGGGNGVYGTSNGPGVYGITTGSSFGVYGVHNSSGNYGYLGGGGQGVAGISSSSTGVLGQSSSGTGVNGQSNTNDGVYGFSGTGNGVYGATTSGYAGQFVGRTMISGGPSGDLLYVQNTGGGRGIHVVTGSDTALWAQTTTGFAALDARKPGGLAGHFEGNVEVLGNLSKSSGAFKIDHPLDPENKYLYHSFVESPDMKNVYDGVVTTDDKGRAVVELPDWFEALNRDFRYQLTVIGRFAQAIVEEEIRDNHFTIRTSLASVKVSWQVTGIRQDPYANAHRIRVEEEKPAEELGTYLHPEAWGQPPAKSVEYVHHPELLQQRDDRQKQPQ